jgi:hypothetical protein
MPIDETQIASMRAALKAEGVSDDENDYVIALAIRIESIPAIDTQQQYEQMKLTLGDALATMSVRDLD